MFAVSESMKARAFLDELQTHHVDLLAELPAEQRKTLQAEEARLRRELTAATDAFNALPDFGPKPTDEQLAQQKKAARAVFAARDALYEHLSEVKAASKTYRDLITHQAKTATLADLQKRLDEGELVLSYSVGTDNSYVIAIRNDGAKFTQLVFDEPTAKRFGVESGPATREKLKTALLSEEHGVMPGLSHPKNTPDDFLERLAALWTLLLPEAERDALAGGDVKRLLVLPTDALSLLPFEALVIRTDGELKFLLDVGPPVSYAPSATVLLSLTDREAKAANSETPVLTLGDPAYPQPSEQKDTVDRMMAAFNVSQPLRAALTRLPFSGWEANWVQQHFKDAGVASTLLTGKAATEAAVRREAPGRQIIHLACHGMAEQSYSNFFGELGAHARSSRRSGGRRHSVDVGNLRAGSQRVRTGRVEPPVRRTMAPNSRAKACGPCHAAFWWPARNGSSPATGSCTTRPAPRW